MNRKRVWLTSAAILVVAGTGLLLFRPSSADPPQPVPSCRLIAPASTAAGDTVPSGVQVVETGYSTVGPNASMGTLIRNETGKVAYRTLVTFDAVDATGRTVIHETARIWQTQVVPIIRPGGSVAVGTAVLLDQNSDRSLKSIDSIKVTVKADRWLEPGDGNIGLGPVTAGVIGGSGQRAELGKASLQFTTESANCATTDRGRETGMASRGISLVFRDASGAIVGGDLDISPRHDTCLPGSRTDERFGSLQPAVPSRADLDKTSISVYCDFDRPPASKVPGTPIN